MCEMLDIVKDMRPASYAPYKHAFVVWVCALDNAAFEDDLILTRHEMIKFMVEKDALDDEEDEDEEYGIEHEHPLRRCLLIAMTLPEPLSLGS